MWVISKYSLITAVLLFNLAMVIIAVLRRRSGYLSKYSTLALVLLALAGAVRIVLPLDFQFTFVVNSFNTLPKIKSFLDADLWPGAGRFELRSALILIWGIGSAVVILRETIVFHKDCVRRRGYRTVDNTQAVRVAQELRLTRAETVVSPDIGIPYVTGLFKARIYLPDIAMPDDMLALIIKHEYRHFRSRDILIKLFYLCLYAAFWWNPIVHVFQRELDRLLEIQCDYAMVRHMNENERVAYLQALLMVIKHILPTDTVTLANASSFVQSGQGGFMDQRFKLILDGKAKPAAEIVSSVLVVLLFLASFLIIIQPAGHPPAEDVEGTYKANRDNAYIVYTQDNTYELHIAGQFFTVLPETSLDDESYKGMPIINEEDLIE